MKVLVTGGSGFLGINLIRYLHARDFELVSLELVEFDYPDMIDKVTAIKGDSRNEKDVERAMEGADMVVHCAAALPLYPAHDIYTTDVEGTRMLLQVAHRKNIKRFVMISSTAV